MQSRESRLRQQVLRLLRVVMMLSLIRVLFGGCPGGRHYFIKSGNRWVCSLCGASG